MFSLVFKRLRTTLLLSFASFCAMVLVDLFVYLTLLGLKEEDIAGSQKDLFVVLALVLNLAVLLVILTAGKRMRTKDFGILYDLGYGSGNIRILVMIESAIWCFPAGIIVVLVSSLVVSLGPIYFLSLLVLVQFVIGYFILGSDTRK